MARLPTADDLPQNTAQTAMKTGGYTARPMTGIASGLDKAGAELMAKAEQDRKIAESYEADKAKVDYLKRESELRMKYETDPDYKTAPDRMKGELDQFRTERMSGLPANAAKDFDLWGQQQVVQAYERQDGDRKLKYKAEELGTWKESSQYLLARAAEQGAAGDEDGKLETLRLFNEQNAKISALSVEARGQVAAWNAGGAAADVGKMMADKMPANKVAGWLKKRDPSIPPQPSPAVSQEGATSFIMDRLENEPNKHPDPAGRGFSKFGINSEAHPEVNLDTLTKEQAAQIYKRDYWDKMNIDSLPNEMKMIVYDAAINQGVGFTSEALARSGNNPEMFMQLRKQRYLSIGGSNVKGWLSRLKQVGEASGVGSSEPSTGFYEIDRWRDADPIGFKNFVEAKEVEAKKITAVEVFEKNKFASPQEIGIAIAENSDNEQAVKNLRSINEAVLKDPATYVRSEPSVIEAQQNFMANPTDEDAKQKFLMQMKTVQERMGVPQSKIAYVDTDEITSIKAMMDDPNTEVKTILTEVDKFRFKYSPVLSHAVDELRGGVNGENRVDGKFATLMGIDSPSVRADLAKALISKDNILEKIIPQEGRTDFNKRIESNEKLLNFGRAMSLNDYGIKTFSDIQESVKSLSLYYMRTGTEAQTAIDTAVDNILNIEVEGTIILPKGTDPKPVQNYADDFKGRLDDMNIEMPVGFEKDNPLGSDAARAIMMRGIKPIVQGDRVKLIWDNGQPVIDLDRVSEDATGDAKASQGWVSFPVADAFANTYAAPTSMAPEAPGTLRAVIMNSMGKDVNDYFNYKMAYNGDGLFRKGRITPITKEQYLAMGKDEQAKVKQRMENNVQYTNKVLSKIDDNQKENFKKYVAASNGMSVKFQQQKSKPRSGGNFLSQAPGEMSDSDVMRSIGFNLLEMPEWAK